MNRNKTPAPKEGAAADASGLRPLPTPGQLIKYKSRHFGDLYVAKVRAVDRSAATAAIDVMIPGSTDLLALSTVPVHLGGIDACPKGSCIP